MPASLAATVGLRAAEQKKNFGKVFRCEEGSSLENVAGKRVAKGQFRGQKMKNVSAKENHNPFVPLKAAFLTARFRALGIEAAVDLLCVERDEDR